MFLAHTNTFTDKFGIRQLAEYKVHGQLTKNQLKVSEGLLACFGYWDGEKSRVLARSYNHSVVPMNPPPTVRNNNAEVSFGRIAAPLILRRNQNQKRMV